MSAHLESGVPFGRYVLLRRLAVGGMAEIWLARPLDGGGKPVVLKRILPQFASDPEFLEKFREEATLTLSLVHGNIVPVFEIGRVGDDPYIAMEHVPGRDLRSILKRARERGMVAPPGVAAYIASELLRGLDYAHRKLDEQGLPMKLVHRDVSPSNVVVSSEGTVKLLDFGIAKALGRAEATRTGVLRGKVGYMSPEQARGELITASSDLFSTGVVLYELLVAEKLFDGESEPEVLERVKSGQVPRVRDKNPKVPEELERILMKALSRDAADRYPSAAEFLDDVGRFLSIGDGTRRYIGDAATTTQFLLLLFPEDKIEPDFDARTGTHGGANVPGTATQGPPAGPALMLGGAVQIGDPFARTIPPVKSAARWWIPLAAAGIAGAVLLVFWNPPSSFSGTASPTPVVLSKVGSLAVEARNVTGAEIWVDGVFSGKKTPALVKGIATGPRKIVLKHPDYLDWSGEVSIDPRETREVAQDLVPDLRTVTVDSDPPGALLAAKGERCMAPCTFRGLKPSETLFVSGERTGFKKSTMPVRVADAKGTVVLRLDKAQSQTVAATPIAPAGKGRVSFRVFPGWAFLTVDDTAEIDTGALANVELEAGVHKLRIRTDDGRIDLRCSFTIEPGRTVRLRNVDARVEAKKPAACPDVEEIL